MILLEYTTTQWIGIWTIIVVIGIPTVGGIIWLIFKTGGLYDSIESMKPLVAKIPNIEFQVTELWENRVSVSKSPMSLNDKGKHILKESGIKKLTDDHYDKIIEAVKKFDPQNPYQAQRILINVLRDFKDRDDCVNQLENAAYDSGTSIDTVLLVAAINIRDKVIEEIGFKVEDIDKHDPNKND